MFCSRNTSLKQRVKKLKSKEAEETKALEEMVLKVESNLQTTTVGVYCMLSVFTFQSDTLSSRCKWGEGKEGRRKYTERNGG